ncbi:MAG TPA: hypothetical protein VKQ07_11115, partial [Jatrophihabitantaceae bacterium]|nr:hypothetical protein [Jatrophihabitantaceae bacterium]
MTENVSAGPAEGAPDSDTEHEADARALFQADISPRGVDGAIREYVGRLRSGDPGGLPSILGLIVLVVIFASTTTDFLSRNNAANLASQASFIAFIALGLVFYLLLGEIDLSAGTTAGMCAAFAAQSLSSGDLHKAVGDYVYALLVVGMAGAIVLGVLNRMITAPLIVALGLILLLTGATNHHEPLAFFLAVSIGVTVGTYSGVLVARLGIPSFIVTLALFLSWEG